MKARSRQRLYLDLSAAKKRKRAIEWCLKFLWIDIDGMSESNFLDIVTEYECIVAYPENIGYYFFPIQTLPTNATDDDIENLIGSVDDEESVRDVFKDYQRKAIELMEVFQKMKNQPGDWLKLDTTMAFTISVNRVHTYKITDKKGHDFEYSYARQIAKALDGKTFGDAFKKCAHCGRYFAVLSKHPRESCNHNCAMLIWKNNSRQTNPILARKQGNLESQFSRLKKIGYTDAELQSLLRGYIKQKKIEPEEIPRYIKKFLGNKK